MSKLLINIIKTVPVVSNMAVVVKYVYIDDVILGQQKYLGHKSDTMIVIL